MISRSFGPNMSCYILVQPQNRPVDILQPVKRAPWGEFSRVRARRCIGYLISCYLRIVLRILRNRFSILLRSLCSPLRILFYILLNLDRLILRIFRNIFRLLLQLVALDLGIVRHLSGSMVDVASSVFEVVSGRHNLQ
jgi:hypothetical protein